MTFVCLPPVPPAFYPFAYVYDKDEMEEENPKHKAQREAQETRETKETVLKKEREVSKFICFWSFMLK